MGLLWPAGLLWPQTEKKIAKAIASVYTIKCQNLRNYYRIGTLPFVMLRV